MKARSFESKELIMLTAVGAVATIIALIIGHPRLLTMIGLTLLMALMAFVAQFRHHREVRTLRGRGQRKRRMD